MSTQEPRSVNQRSYYRVEYPLRECPSFISDESKEYRVLDISEKGMRLQKNENPTLEVGSVLKGTITLHTSGKADVTGKVVRDTEECIAVLLRVGIPFSQIVNEQQYLQQLNKYID